MGGYLRENFEKLNEPETSNSDNGRTKIKNARAALQSSLLQKMQPTVIGHYFQDVL